VYILYVATQIDFWTRASASVDTNIQCLSEGSNIFCYFFILGSLYSRSLIISTHFAVMCPQSFVKLPYCFHGATRWSVSTYNEYMASFQQL